jgi:hypothetical protein
MNKMWDYFVGQKIQKKKHKAFWSQLDLWFLIEFDINRW